MSKRVEQPQARQADSKRRAAGRPLASFLVRCWFEPRDADDKEPVLRGYLRNLKSGEETYLSDLKVVEQQILASLLDDEARRRREVETVPAVERAERG